MASLASTIDESDIDEDLALAAALQMSLSSSPSEQDITSSPSQPSHSGNALSGGTLGIEEQLLQQALNASLGIESHAATATASNVVDGPIPARSCQLVSQGDASQEQLMAEVEEAKALASSTAKKRRKSAKKLARRNRRSNSGAGVGEIIISNTVDQMGDDELRSELRRLCVPFPWPSDRDGLAELLKSVISSRAKKSGNKDASPIRKQTKTSGKSRRRKQRKFVPSGDKKSSPASAGEINSAAKTEGVNDIDSDDLIIKQVLAASLKEFSESRNLGSDTRKGGHPGGFNHPTRKLHNSLALEEQKQLERALEENAEDYERQLIFAGLDHDVRVEAEQSWKQLMEDFSLRGGPRPSTEYVVSLARDTVARRIEESKTIEESLRMAELAEKERIAKAEKESEELLIQKRNTESRRARAARFAAAFDKRQAQKKQSDSSSEDATSSKKLTPG